jgi:multiple sugar transport system substrate-binding protein
MEAPVTRPATSSAPIGPPSNVSRRSLLKGTAAAFAIGASPALISACSGSNSPGPSGSASTAGVAGSSITFGSNYSDAAPKAAFASLTSAATSATAVKVTINTVDHNTFQNNISSYLQGTPDSLATWFAGYRMQYFAAQGLLSDLDDVWGKVGGNFSAAAKTLAKGLDGHYYFLPLYNYPWVVFYNKSTFAKNGYTVPTTWDGFVTLAKKMKQDGLIPIAFADKDLWPALGTFDILNLRINGYDYHLRLMQNKASYTDRQVTDVFTQWAEILPYMQSGANGRIWQDAAKALENKQAGMMFQGTNQVAANYASKNLADLDFFPYPIINTAYGQDYMDAPADGFILPKKGTNQAGAKAILEYIGTGPAEAAYLKTDQWDVGLATNIDTSPYDKIQLKSATAIAACKNVSQFADRDTDPAMAVALEALIQKFIDNPSASNVASIQKSAAAQARTIFG